MTSKKETRSARRSAVGFSVHTGWAVLVVIVGPASDPSIVVRRRIELVDRGDERMVYHAAEGLALEDAAALVERASAKALAKANDAFEALAVDVGRETPLDVAGIVEANSTVPSSLEVILRSHALIHTAEGALYRRALDAAARRRKLAVVGVPSKQLHARAAAELGVKTQALVEWLTERGRAVGRPWGRDEKDALLAACVARGAR